MNPYYPEVAARAGHRCEYCLAPEVAFNVAFEVEHIRPESKGGLTSLENLALACRSCNSHKAARLTCLDPNTNEQVAIFHPRQDEHREHFKLNSKLEFVGLTATGRASIVCLAMNSERQVRGRNVWRQLGLLSGWE